MNTEFLQFLEVPTRARVRKEIAPTDQRPQIVAHALATARYEVVQLQPWALFIQRKAA